MEYDTIETIAEGVNTAVIAGLSETKRFFVQNHCVALVLQVLDDLKIGYLSTKINSEAVGIVCFTTGLNGGVKI